MSTMTDLSTLSAATGDNQLGAHLCRLWDEQRAAMNWIPTTQKPLAYEVVLLALDTPSISTEFTTGWWADLANGGMGAWVGLALNQSPPTYQLEEWAVVCWAAIEAPQSKVQP